MAKETTIVRYGADFSSYEKSIKEAQKTWDDFTRGLGMNAAKFTGVAAAVGAVTGAIKVAKDAFFNNEQQLDEWGRTVKSAESLYNGFLNSLNTGDISGYLRNMDSIVNAARDAYDAMDELGTFNAFNQINMGQARVNLTEAMANYREGTGTKEDVRTAATVYQNELRERMQREQAAYEAAVRNIAAQRGVSGDDLMKALSGSYGDYKALKEIQMTGYKTVFQNQGMYGGTTSYNVAAPANEMERLGQALRGLNDTELRDIQALGATAKQTANEIAQTDRQVARILGSRTTTGGGSGSTGKLTQKETYVPAIGSIDEMKAKVKELQDEFNKTADHSIRGQLLVAIDEAQKKLDYMTGKGLTLVERPKGSLSEHLGFGVGSKDKPKNEQQDDLKKVKIPKELIESKSTTNKETRSEIKAITEGVTGILGGLTKMGVELPEGLSQMIGTMQVISGILTSILTITTLIQGTQQAESVFSVIDAILPFARGGIVRAAGGTIIPGNSYSGDNLRMPIMDGIGGWAGVNSGELILNRSQQDRIASQLSNGGMQNLHLTATIKGTDIQLALNNTARQQGRGVYVTSR